MLWICNYDVGQVCRKNVRCWLVRCNHRGRFSLFLQNKIKFLCPQFLAIIENVAYGCNLPEGIAPEMCLMRSGSLLLSCPGLLTPPGVAPLLIGDTRWLAGLKQPSIFTFHTPVSKNSLKLDFKRHWNSTLCNKQVKPGFTNYQPRFSQFIIRTSKIWNNN